jgi:hypothetical protein
MHSASTIIIEVDRGRLSLNEIRTIFRKPSWMHLQSKQTKLFCERNKISATKQSLTCCFIARREIKVCSNIHKDTMQQIRSLFYFIAVFLLV